MKNINFTIAVYLLLSFCYGQIEVSVSTDKLNYEVGDTIVIDVTAYNFSDDLMELWWHNTCQSMYSIDDFRPVRYCQPMGTTVSIVPNWYYIWRHYHNPDDYFFGVGQHKVVGEVINYGISDTLIITVGSSLSSYGDEGLPIKFELFQNHPNPFNPSTTIEFSIPKRDLVTLTVYDILGREVEALLNKHMNAGRYKIQWNASNVPSGIYFIRMQTDGLSQMRKLMVVRLTFMN